MNLILILYLRLHRAMRHRARRRVINFASSHTSTLITVTVKTFRSNLASCYSTSRHHQQLLSYQPKPLDLSIIPLVSPLHQARKQGGGEGRGKSSEIIRAVDLIRTTAVSGALDVVQVARAVLAGSGLGPGTGGFPCLAGRRSEGGYGTLDGKIG